MRIVLDTNVLVSGLGHPGGPASRVVTLILRGPLIALYDERIIAEYREVVGRPRLRIQPSGAAHAIDSIVEHGVGVDVGGVAIAAKARDPKDQRFVDVAVAGGAAAIITRNRADFPLDAGVAIAWPEDVLAWFTPADLRRWLAD